jgi:hypothetical protein
MEDLIAVVAVGSAHERDNLTGSSESKLYNKSKIYINENANESYRDKTN